MINPTIVFKNTKLKKIINVYQKKENGHKTYGIGDFIRGCFCLAQICKKLQIEFDIDISNHPLSKFIVDGEIKKEVTDYDNVPYFNNMNFIYIDSLSFTTDSHNFYNSFIDHLNTLETEYYYLQCNSFPAWKNMHYTERQLLQSKLTPTPEMIHHVQDALYKVGLSSTPFGIIHIRTGDSSLVNGEKTDPKKFYRIYKLLEQIVNNKNRKFLILSDDNILKMGLKKMFYNVSCYSLEITHLGESTNQTADSLKNTMLDFFIIGHAKFVINISFNNWGSGFSEWSSALQNIPYKKIILS